MYRIVSTSVFIAAIAPFIALPAAAQTATDTMGVSLTVQAECTLAADPLPFGTQGLIAANFDVETNLTVECTAGSPYSIGLSAGLGDEATVNLRKMTHTTVPTNTVEYQLFRNAGRTEIWGNTMGVDTFESQAATGAAENIAVYARLPEGQNVPTGEYADTVTATIWYGTGLAAL